MARLGFINAFDELAAPDRRLGRKVANYGLTAALIEHASFEQLHFFLPFAGALEPFRRQYGPFLGDGEQSGRVRLLPSSMLPGIVAQEGYQAIHCAELDRWFLELCHLRNRLAPKAFPITATPHSLSYWPALVRGLYKVLPGARDFDAVFCSSEAARDMLAAYFGHTASRLRELGLASAGFAGQLRLCPLGVRAADFAGLPRAQARRRLNLQDPGVVFLCLGRLTPSDKFDLTPLLGAFALLARRRPVSLLLAGAQRRGYGQRLLAEAAEMGLAGRVHLFADFDSDLKPSLLAAADVFVSPADNLQETFGLSIVEAMAAGLPVVASDFSGYRDLVVHGQSGFLVPTIGPDHLPALEAIYPLLLERVGALQFAQRTAVDLGALLAAMEELAASDELRRKMGSAGRRRVARRFDWPRVVAAMEEHWSELARQALAADRRPVPPDVLGGVMQAAFGRFPSRSLAASDLISTGPLAPEFKAGRWARRPHPNLAGAISTRGLTALLAALDSQGGQARVSQLQAALAGQMPPAQCSHLVLYGLKYGVLRMG